LVHHSATGWTGEVAFEALLDVEPELLAEIAPYIPHFRFLLDDISPVSNEALKARAMTALGRLVLFCLKNSRTPEELVRELASWADLVREVRSTPNGVAALMLVFRYIFQVNERYSAGELVTLLVQAVGEEGKEEMASVADQLRAEGECKGRREKGCEIILRQLRSRFGELPEAAVMRVKAADSAELDQWTERVLSARTLSDVLGGI
jgi:hypothetical protein